METVLNLLTVVDGATWVVMAIVVGALLGLWHFSSGDNVFHVVDLLTENGKASKTAVILLGAFVSTTWAFLYSTLETGEADSTLLLTYGGLWVAPILARILKSSDAKAESYTAETSTKTIIHETQ